ncbi:MAG: hypothetical protein R6V62_02715 [Candidatus Fermentibacteraceae bacterium]
MKTLAMIAFAVIFSSACGTSTSVSSSGRTTAVSPGSSGSAAALIEEVLFSGPPPTSAAALEVVETFPAGEVDWSGNSVRATGIGVLDPQNPNTAQARLMAERAAVVVAQRNLLEIVEGVRVDSETRVENFMTDYDVIHTRVQGVVRNARQVGQARYDAEAGTVEVELQMDIYSPTGLSGALSTALADSRALQETLSPQVRDFLSQYSGLIIDGGETGLTPSMFPRIFDENGSLLLDTSQYASYLGSGADAGLRFISDLQGILDQSGLSGSPLVLSAIDAVGEYGSDIVLSAAEAGGGNILKQALPYLLSAGRFLMRVIL